MKLWINGKWCDGTAGVMDVENPATGEVIAQVAKAGAADVDNAVAAAKTAFPEWSSMPPRDRSKCMWQLADLMEANIEELAKIESEDTGKPYEFLSLGGDLPFCIDNMRFFAGSARDTSGHHAGEYTQGYTTIYRREPVGVVGQIAPWNYPLLMAIWKIGAALAAGCTTVLKPASLTPRTSLMLGELCQKAGIPDGVVNVLTGEVGPAIVNHKDIRMISVTGATSTGAAIMQSSAESIKRVHLELGGKAPVVVFEDATPELVAEKVSLGTFCNSGQDCTAATRIICHESIVDQVTEALVAAMKAVKVGNPFDSETMMGSMISKSHMESVDGFVQRAKASGAGILCGGKILDGPGYFYAPTVINNVAQNSEIVQKEVFGPVVTIQTFKEESDALAMANDTVFGLASSVFTHDVARSMRVAKALEFGCVWVNDHLPLVSEAPHGGFKQSGFGKDLSAEAVGDYLVTKHVMVNTTV
ncbi:aminobutyraldehyde dehydrogenase [uncultured Desulfobacter sp.]|uniref:aminobutyraldehyde dehydrogenase n=1 Tax=uncultured Desulfobacter sp. TaxID=240139 RepID=UPI0029F4DC67|nr:aminobutyraldehyde dehydrogenase [uncultured Desulfobacter sp.]